MKVLTFQNLTMRLLSAILILMIGIVNSYSQSGFSTMPLINTGERVINSEADLNDTEDYKHVSEIYANLVQARGDFRYPMPDLYLRDEEQYVASIDYTTNKITLEKKAYDICKSMGDEAIAFLLAHELTHFYEKHAWRNGFAHDNQDLEIGRTLNQIQDGVANETEADYLGGFLAYSAGYGMFTDGDKIINNIYKEYELSDEISGYPSKADRIELNIRTAKAIEKLVDVFEMANYLYATGYYADAYLYYQYVLRQYQSRELYNNLGVLAMIQAMQLIGSTTLVYVYPSEVDLNLGPSKGVDDKQSKINTLLDIAIRQFDAATNLDANYAPAILNKSITYALKDDFVKARFYLEHEARPLAKANVKKYGKTLLDLDVLEAIIEARSGNTSKAKSLLEKASAAGSDIAGVNLKILINNGQVSSPPPPSRNVSLMKDKIGSSVEFKSFVDNPNGQEEIKYDEMTSFYIEKPEDGNSKYLVHINEDLIRSYQVASNQYTGSTSSGIKVGSMKSEVITAHGDPQSTLETVEGQLLVYPTVIFVIQKGTVAKWILYGKSLN